MPHPPSSSENKEHHFCFAYVGQRLQSELFEELKFARVQGTSAIDGTQFVRVTLQRTNGKRKSAIPKVISEYNRRATGHLITPIHIQGTESPIVCFKLAQPVDENPILAKIETDQSTSRSWSWSAGNIGHKTHTQPSLKHNEQTHHQPKSMHHQPKSDVKSRPADKHRCTDERPKAAGDHLISTVERLLIERKLDPATMGVKAIANKIKRAYYDVNEAELDETHEASYEETEFVNRELDRYVEQQRMYIVSPPPKKKTLEAKSMPISDCDLFTNEIHFGAEEGEATQTTQQPTLRPNTTIMRYFQTMLPNWNGQTLVTVTSREIALVLNNYDTGVYRHSCVPVFMRPFVYNGAVQTEDGLKFTIHVDRVAGMLSAYTNLAH